MCDTLAIIVTFNRKGLLKECLTALLGQNHKLDILIIDNASSDGTGEMIKNEYHDSQIKYVNTGKNLGGAGGYNFGLKEACRLNYDYFWLMDDDCIVKKDSLDMLFAADKELNGKWSFLSSKVLWKDGSICKTNVQRRSVARKINNFVEEKVKVDYASFVSLLIKKKDVLKYGLPIKDFFIWSDDLEYTRRLGLNTKLSGYLINKSEVVHKCNENIGVDISKDSKNRLDRYKYIYRNDVYTFKREGLNGILYLFFRYIYHVTKIVFSGKEVFGKIKIMTKGYIDGLSFNPSVEFAN